MGNPATLAPPFNSETAGYYSRMAVIAREKNRIARAEAELQRKLDEAASTPVSRAERQVARILSWLEQTEDKEEHAKLLVSLDKLWSKAYPTQAAVKSSRSRQPVAPVAPISPVNPAGDPQ